MDLTNLNRDKKRGRKTPLDLSTMVYGKVPPQARDLEEAVLGAIMLEKGAFDTVAEILKSECFYVDAHQRIFRAMKSLSNKSQPIDMLTVVEELRTAEELDMVGGPYYVTKLTNAVTSSAHIEAHSRIILQKFIQRELIRISGEIISDAYEDSTDVFDLLDDAESKIYGVTSEHLRNSVETIDSVLVKTIQRIEDMRSRNEDITGVPSGFANLDRVTYGWQSTDLIILAARPSVGKTAFALNLARNAAMNKHKKTPVAFFSLEMSAGQLVQRILAAESEIWLEKISRGRMEEYEMKQLYEKGIQPLSSAGLFIDDTPALNIFELRAKCRRLKNAHNIGLIIIDYLQLMSGTGENRNANREQEISNISRSLKALAKELHVPVIALSQLSREVEKRKEGNKIPQLSDLRECVTGDTLVWLSSGQRVPIKELVGKTPEVWTLDHNHKLTHSTTEMVWPVARKKVYELRLASGRTLKATADHKTLSFEGWKTIEQINAGERLATIRCIPVPAVTQSVSPNKLILLAHLMGDGSYLSHQPLRYTTASEENSRAVRKAAEEEFGSVVNRHESKGAWHQLVFSNNGNRWHPKGLNQWLREIDVYNQRSYQKKIPGFVFTLSNEDVSLFLRHLWATDGTLYTPSEERSSAPKIAFSTNSHQLAADVAALLLRFSVLGRIRTVKQGEYRPMYVVEVCGLENQMRFLDTVGAFGPKLLQANVLREYLTTKKANTNVDTIPVAVFDKVKNAMKEKMVSHRKMAALRGTAYGGNGHFKFSPSRQVLEEYGELLGDDEIKKMARSDLFWDKVTSVTSCGEEDVFDLTVATTHNWIANGGVVTHNSGAIEQDADMVCFIYRPEYHEINQNEMGESIKGETYLRIAKHRNGSLENLKFRARLEIQKFFEDNGDEFNGGFNMPPNWKPVTDTEGPKLYIQTGSKMNDLPDEDDPF